MFKKRNILHVLVFIFPSIAASLGLDAIESLTVAASTICQQSPIEGSNTSVEAEGELTVQIGKLLGSLVSAGGDLEGQVNEEKWSGIPQDDLVAAISASNDCRVNVLKTLLEYVELTSSGISKQNTNIYTPTAGERTEKIVPDGIDVPQNYQRSSAPFDKDLNSDWSASGSDKWLKVLYRKEKAVSKIRFYRNAEDKRYGQTWRANVVFSNGFKVDVQLKKFDGWEEVVLSEPVVTDSVQITFTEVFPESNYIKLYELEIHGYALE